MISALNQYTHQNFIDLIQKYQISFHEKKLGQLFCDQSAQQIIDMLKVVSSFVIPPLCMIL